MASPEVFEGLDTQKLYETALALLSLTLHGGRV